MCGRSFYGYWLLKTPLIYFIGNTFYLNLNLNLISY
jgi:hypothetical protein